MGNQPLQIKLVLLIPYLVLVVMLPITRGERLQKYHFFHLTEKFHTVPLHDFPVIGNMSQHNHKHLSLFYYPAKGTPKISDFFHAALSAIVPETGRSVIAAGRHVQITVCSAHSPPLFYAKTVSGLSPPMHSDI